MKTSSLEILALTVALCIAILPSSTYAIKCFQCSTEKDGEGCGAYDSFDKTKHIAVDCMGEEANSPGTFCFKSIQQGPRGFIWDGRWRSVVRRCAQVSERGISWGCDWGYNEKGVYWEECYCAEDSCNSTTTISLSWTLLTTATIILGFTSIVRFF